MDTCLWELSNRQTKQGHTIGHVTAGPTREENKSGRLPTAGPRADRWVQRQEAGSSGPDNSHTRNGWEARHHTAACENHLLMGLRVHREQPRQLSPEGVGHAGALHQPRETQQHQTHLRPQGTCAKATGEHMEGSRGSRHTGLACREARGWLTCLPRDDPSLERPV